MGKAQTKEVNQPPTLSLSIASVHRIMRFHRYRSPIGNLILAADNGFLCYCLWEDSMDNQLLDDWEEDKTMHETVLTEACRQMDEYFSGVRKSFSLPLKPFGTVFQQHAWQALQKIPYGKTISYAEEARLMNSPKAVRAVGNANRHNPLMIIIPCHRVVGSNGHIGGYVGGTERKKWLYRFENVCQ